MCNLWLYKPDLKQFKKQISFSQQLYFQSSPETDLCVAHRPEEWYVMWIAQKNKAGLYTLIIFADTNWYLCKGKAGRHFHLICS